MLLPSFSPVSFPNCLSSASVHPLDSLRISVTPSPVGSPLNDLSFLSWLLFEKLPSEGWRGEREQLTLESYQPLHLMSCLNIISCPAYVTSPQGKGHASACTIENRECCWHSEYCHCELLVIGRCE